MLTNTLSYLTRRVARVTVALIAVTAIAMPATGIAASNARNVQQVRSVLVNVTKDEFADNAQGLCSGKLIWMVGNISTKSGCLSFLGTWASQYFGPIAKKFPTLEAKQIAYDNKAQVKFESATVADVTQTVFTFSTGTPDGKLRWSAVHGKLQFMHGHWLAFL
jgi:hypothetical protein